MIKKISFSLIARLGAAMALLSLTLFQPGGVQAEANFTGCGGGMSIPVQNADYEQQVLDLVNQQRALVNAPPLKRNPALDNSARYQSEDMEQDNYFQHDSYDVVNGALKEVCAWNARIKTWYSGGSMGENIAAGYGTPTNVMSGWMNSPGHKANILSTSYREIGIGYYNGSSGYGNYWTQDFGTVGSVYPLLINKDAATTDTRSVAVYIYGTWTQMRLQNDNDATGDWQPFQQSFNWVLDPGVGVHTLKAELKSDSQTATSSDTITLTKDDTPGLAGLPDTSGLIFSQTSQSFSAPAISLAPVDPAGVPLTWTATSTGNWFTLSPASGTTPDKLTITPAQSDTLQPGVYPGSVTVTVTSPAGTLNSPHVIQLTLVVVAGPLKTMYLPMVGH